MTKRQEAKARHTALERTAQSTAWLYGRELSTSAFNLVATAILARQLTPGDFGLVALAQVILRFLVSLGAGGTGDYVIYDRQEGREIRVQAAFWLNLTFAILVGSAAFAVIPLISHYYVQTALPNLLRLLTVKYVLDQVSVIPDSLLRRSLDYPKLVTRDTVLQLLSAAASVLLAVRGWGVWSLVVPPACISCLRFLLVMRMARWVPRLPMQIRYWPRISRYSASVIGTNLATTFTAEGDTLLIGKTLGSAALGTYNFAWQTANLVSRNVTGVVGSVAMPALTTVAGDRTRLRSAFHRMIRLLAVFTFPLLIGLFVVADLFVLTVYGPQWKSSILPLRILIIFAIRHAVGSPATVVYNVAGRPDLGCKGGLALIPFYLLSIWVGSWYGIVGVASGVTIARTLYGFVQFWLAARLLGESLIQLLAVLVEPLAAACLMALPLTGARLLLQYLAVPEGAKLVALIMFGGSVYIGILARFHRQLLADLIIIVEHLMPSIGCRLRHWAGQKSSH